MLRLDLSSVWKRCPAERLAAIAIAAVVVLWGVVQTGAFDAHRLPASSPEGQPAAALVQSEGSLLLTESPISKNFHTPTKRASKPLSQAIATNRSGLTEAAGQGSLALLPSESDFGNGDTIFPSAPDRSTKSRPKLVAAGNFRTLCVRLCDGYYWPINFTTTPGGLADDKATCEQSCGVPVRLFFYRNPDGQPEDAVDLRGERYASLPNAFRYRSEYVDQCKCQPHPWEAASLDRHQRYAQLMQEGKLALYDNRKPKKRRPKSKNVVVIDVAALSAAIDSSQPTSTPKTSIASIKPSKKKPTLAIRSKGSKQSSFPAAMGITKVGQSSSGKSYLAKKANVIFDKRK